MSIALALLARGLPTLPNRVPLGMLVLPAAIAGAAVAVPLVGTRAPLQTLTLTVIVGTFVLALNARVWLAMPPILVDLTVQDLWLDSLGMSLRFAITLAAVLLTVATLFGSDMSVLRVPAVRRVLLPTLIFIAVSTAINLLFSDLAYVIKYLRYQLTLTTPLVLLLLLMRDRPAIRTVVLTMLAIAVASGLFAIGQRIGGPAALYATSDGLPWGGQRASGLSSSPVMLASNMLTIGVTALGFLVVVWSPSARRRYQLLLATVVIVAAMYVSMTRSAILGMAAGLVVVLLLVDAPRRQQLLGMLVLGALVLTSALLTGAVDERLTAGAEEDGSAASHIAVGQVAVSVSLDNALLGVGHENFLTVSLAYEDEVDVGVGGLSQRIGERIIGQIRPHNDFLEVWSSWGIIGLITYIWILVNVLLNCVISWRSTDPFIRGLAVGCAAALVSYAVNSFFHNYLDSTVVLWVAAALSAGLAQLSTNRTDRLHLLRGMYRQPLSHTRAAVHQLLST